MIAGAFLLVIPSIAVAGTPPNAFSFVNHGENANVAVTNNNSGSNFTIVAALEIEFAHNLTGFNVTSVWSVFGNRSFSPISNGTSTWYLLGNLSTGYYSNNQTAWIISHFHSYYALTGIGSNNFFNMTGGVTNDLFSVISGRNASVFIQSGAGNSTYTLILGVNSTVSISSWNGTATYNSYNIEFGYT